MKKTIALVFIIGVFTRSLMPMELDEYEACQDEQKPINLHAQVFSRHANGLLKQAHIQTIREQSIAKIFPKKNKPAQCLLLDEWLRSDAREENLRTLLGIFLRANKLSTRKQAHSQTFLRQQLETHAPLLCALGTIMRTQRYPDNLPLKPLYTYVDNGRQKTLRRKLLAHSTLESKDVDMLVFRINQELAKYA